MLFWLCTFGLDVGKKKKTSQPARVANRFHNRFLDQSATPSSTSIKCVPHTTWLHRSVDKTQARHATSNSLEHWLINAMCFSGSNPIVWLSRVKAKEQFHSQMIWIRWNPHRERMLQIAGGFHFEIAWNLVHSYTCSPPSPCTVSELSAVPKAMNLNDNWSIK